MKKVILHVSYHCKSEKDAGDFVRAIKASGVQGTVRAEDGCEQYDYHISCEQPDTVVLLERWRDIEALQAHMAQPHMATIRSIKDEFVAESYVERYTTQDTEIK